jgi:hypothetical protein
MTAPNYAPTTHPGDTRRRVRYIGIRTPLGAPPQIEILEQDVIRTAAGERVLEDLGNVPVGPFNPGQEFPLKDPQTDADLGDTAMVADALVLIHSWVRQQQALRDAGLPADPLAAHLTAPTALPAPETAP